MNLMKRFKEEIDRFPEGSNNHSFFKELCKNLEPDGLRKPMRNELNQSHADLSGTVQQYFKYHIKYTSALKAVDCSQLQQNEFARDNVELFHLNLLKKYVHNDKPDERLKLFEGSQTLLTKMLESKQKSKPVKLFTKSVEGNIDEFCIQFSEYVLQKKVDACKLEKYFDKAIESLSPKVALLDSAEVRLNTVTQELQAVISTYYKVLSEGIEILNKLLELFQQKLDGQLLRSKFISDKSAHLLLKAQCLKLEVLAATYTKQAVKALRIIKGKLEEKKRDAEKEFLIKSNQLEQFQILGPEYEQLVENYQLLVEKMDKQQWAIEHLKAESALKEK